ncbi:MAG: choice-of-anchor D domain-containing protein, partial [Candidatus Cloacimonadaceae bacterium]
MKSIAKFILLLSILLTFSSLVFADTVQIGSGTGTFSYLPIYTLYSYNYTQQIYTQQQINRAGEISALRFFYTTGVISASKDWKIYMGHSTRTAFSNTTDWEPVANLTLVYDGDVSPFLPPENNWMNIPLDTAFNYNNTSNLIIAVYEDTPNYSSTISWRSFTASTNSGIYFYSDGTIPNPQSPPAANAITSNLAQIQLIFPNTSAPLAPTLVSPGNGDEVFTNAQLRWQPTYGAGDPESYSLYFGTNPNPPLLASNLTETTYTPDLQGDTTYYWKVVANNAVGASPASPIWSFTTTPPGIIQIGDGTASTYRPFSTLYGYERTASLYTQDQIGTYGMVTRLAWSVATTGTASVPYKIWMKSIPENTLTAQTWDDMVNGAILVKEGNYSFSSTGWHNFILDVPFIYTTGNLMIGVQSDSGGSGIGGYSYFHYTTGDPNKHQYWYQDGSPSTNAGYLNANLPNIMMHIAEPTGDPSFMITPTSYDFGDVRVGSNRAQDFTITNVGGGDLIVSSITISGSPSITLSNLPTLPATLATIENTSFSVNFAPTALGPASATVTITDNMGGRSTHTVQVMGNGAEFLIIGDGSSNLYLPVNAYYGYTYSQSIYLQSEISTQGQRIEKLAYYWNGAGVGNLCNGWTIYMGHTERNAFTSTGDWLSLDELTQVYMGQPNIPAVAGWIEVILDEPFIYNNIQNLVIAVDENTPSYDGSSQFFYSTHTPTVRSLRYYSDSINPDPAAPPAATLVSGYPNLKLTFGEVPAGAVFSISPTAYDFGNVRVGNTKNKNFTITNQGGSDLGINSITISGNAGFSLTNLPTLPLTLGTVESAMFNVAFAPTVIGDASATITITDNRGNRTSHTVQVTGYGAEFLIIGEGTTSTYRPFCTLYGYERSAALYTQDQIGTYGMITRLAWSVATTGTTTVPYKIWIKTVTNETMNAQTWDSLIDGAILVKEGNHLFNSTGWHDFILDVPFFYTTGNLLIGIQSDYGGSGTGGYPYIHYTAGVGNKHQTWSQDSSPSTGSGNVNANLPNIMMFISPPTGDPAFMVNPSSHDFGDVRVGSGKSRNFTITNVGGGDLVISSISISGNAAFTLTNLPTLPATLATVQNTTFTVNFAPTALGAASATITITDNIGNRTEHEVEVTGNGAQFMIIGEGSSNLYLPVNAYYSYTYSQSIYLQSEIDTQNQRIERLAYYWNGAGVGNLSNGWTIYMGHTNQTAFTGTTSWIPLNQLVPVYIGQPNIPATPGWIEVLLTNPFIYNNTENLVIAVHENTPNYDGSAQFFYSTTTPSNRSLRYYSDSVNPDPSAPPTGTLVAGFPNIKVSFGDIPTSPVLVYQPSALNFGMCAQNVISEPQTVMLMNHGMGTLNLAAGDVSIFGTDAAMFNVNTNALPAALGPGQSVLLNVTFTPTSEGAKSATLRIVYNEEDHDVALSGNGLPAGIVTIGNGTAQSSYPFYSLYEDARTQMLFTVDELLNGGAFPGQVIEHIAFNVLSFNNIALNGLMIRLKTTDATSLNGFDTDNASFTTCYQATYAINTTGWIYFEFDEPFFWNGAENLLVDVAFDNSSWTGNSVVYATAEPGKTWAVNTDGASGPTLTGGYAQANRPNTRFIFAGTASGDPELMVTPTVYSFGDVTIGGSKSKNIRMMNIGGGSLNVTNIEISGSLAFSLSALPTLPVEIEFAQAVNFNVVYAPIMMGNDTATITITDDQENRYTLSLGSPARSINSRSNRIAHTVDISGSGVNDITIGDGSQNDRVPLDFWYRNSLYETIYTQDELGNFVGMVTGLKLYTNFSTAVSNNPVKLWLGSTTLTNLSASWIPATQLELVYDGTMNFPSGDNVISFTFPEPYMHLDGGNLVLMAHRPMEEYYSSTNYFKTSIGNANRARNDYSDSTTLDPMNPASGSLTANYPKITFVVIPGGVGHINGTVLGPDSQPLPGVTVTLDGRPVSVQTNQQGFFAIPNQLPGNYSLTFTKHTYVTQVINFELEEDETEIVDITMQFMPRVTVSGTILASDTAAGIAGANIRFTGYETFMGTSTANGTFTMPNVFANQSYNYVISAVGYVSTTGELNLGAANHNMGNITLAEVAYAPNTVSAELSPTYDAVSLSWNAPDPNA